MSRVSTAAQVRNDLTIYDRHAASWWDRGHPVFASLHRRKDYCVEVLDRWLASTGRDHDLTGLDVIDLGCGGGLLAEPLAARGARVIGVDTSEPSLHVARSHVGARAEFLHADLRDTGLPAGSADLIVMADVVEHIEDPAAGLRETTRLLRKGGHAFITTINRTRRARWLAVTLAEGVGLIPRGTHDSRMFVKPRELRDYATSSGLEVAAWQGERVCVWRTLRDWAIRVRTGPSLALGYSVWLHKPLAESMQSA